MSDTEPNFKVISKFVAKWALPNEGIPLFLIWSGNLSFDSIGVEMPDNFSIRSYYNVEKKDRDSRKIMLNELKKQGYVGFVFTSPNLENTSEKASIALNFLKNEHLVHREEFETRIIRPKIELQVPEKMDFLPNVEMKIDIGLKYTGYGNIYGKIMVSEDVNKFVLDAKNARDLFMVMANCHTFKAFMNRNNISEEEFLGSEIPEDQYDYRELLLETSQMGEFTAEAFFDTMKRTLENKKMMEILEKSIEQIRDASTGFFSSIIDFVEKRPVEGVFLSDTKIEPVQLEQGNRVLYICIGYVDDFGNYYCQTKRIQLELEKRKTITFGSKWDEQAGNWGWLKKEQKLLKQH